MIFEYLIHIGTLIALYAIFSMSLQLLLGFTGVMNLGSIGLFAIGAYSYALFTLNGVSFGLALGVAGLISGVFSILLGLLTYKLKSDYLALATLSFSYLVYAVLQNNISFTGGPLGLSGISSPNIWGLSFETGAGFLVLISLITFCVYICLKLLVNSKYGQALQATRDNQLALRVLGFYTLRLKIFAFVYSGFLFGVGGAFYASYMTFIDPASFTLMQLIPIVCIVIVGGIASFEGGILATIILVCIVEPLRIINLPIVYVGPISQMLYAVVLCLFLLKKPQGLYGQIILK